MMIKQGKVCTNEKSVGGGVEGYEKDGWMDELFYDCRPAT